MAEYTKIFENPYPNGWEDLPSENTPITADALQEHTDAIENIEQYLEDNPIEKGGADVEWNQITEDGTKIAEVTINGETTEVFAPQGGGGGGEAFVEMTKAEYDALPDTKLTDGVPRLITDYSENGCGFSGIDFSNVIHNIDTKGADYIAESDGWLIGSVKSDDTYTAQLTINNILVAIANKSTSYVCIPIKQGQNIKTRDGASPWTYDLKLYNLL